MISFLSVVFLAVIGRFLFVADDDVPHIALSRALLFYVSHTLRDSQ